MGISTTPSPILTAQARNTQAALYAGFFSLRCCSPQSPIPLSDVTSSAGLNHIDLIECCRRGIDVANAASTDVADLAVGLLLDILRKISTRYWYVEMGCGVNKDPILLGTRYKKKTRI
ncbi:hypothetical protein OROMI_004996 [Orobanche minor]